MLTWRSRGTWVGWTAGLGCALAIGFWTGACASRTAPPPLAVAPNGGTEPAPRAEGAPAPAPATSDLRHELLNAVAWMQTSAEFRASMLAAYGRATARLDALLDDKTRTAALEQTGDFSGKPPAVILDVDETVLDNTLFEGELIRSGASAFDTKQWDAWVSEARAPAFPGAVEFLKVAREKGIATFFVTNRDASGEAATVANLRQVGIEASAETVLVKGENGWTSDKTPRRAHVASSHRILMLVGDDLGDFVRIQGKDLAQRAAFVDAHAHFWGERWIILPNPAYGSWERAIVGGGDPVRKKREAVRGLTE